MGKRQDYSKEKYGWLSGSSEEEVKKYLEEKGDSYDSKYKKFKEGLAGKKDNKEKKPKKKNRFKGMWD